MLLPDSLDPQSLARTLASEAWPLVLDVRRAPAFAAAETTLPTARRADATTVTAAEIGPAPAGVLCFCVHGHEVSQVAAARLRAEGVAAAWLEGGIEAWTAAGLPLVATAPDAAARFGAGTVWVTRRRPKIDRIAGPWVIDRFVDARARWLFVEPARVVAVAEAIGAIAFDVEGANGPWLVTHDGPRCSVDTLLDRYRLDDPTLRRLATIVRGADTGALDLAPEAAGLLAVSLGMAAREPDDHRLLARAFPIYDALYARLRDVADETHSWPPEPRQAAATKELAR